MNDHDTGVFGKLVRMDKMMDKLQQDLDTLIKRGPRAACEERINISVADFNVVYIGTFTTRVTGSWPNGKVVSG